MDSQLGMRRVVIERVRPEVDHGRFPIKRTVGEDVIVEADIFADGHDVLSAILVYHRENTGQWHEVPMEPLVNDSWRGSFTVSELGRYRYTLMAWVDAYRTWRQNLGKKVEAGQDVSVELLSGAQLVEETSQRASGSDRQTMLSWAKELGSTSKGSKSRIKLALSQKVSGLMDKYASRESATVYPKELVVVVDRDKARFSTWYEAFPRSCSSVPGQHGTFKDCEARLPYIAGMGFDVLYFPPIHPVSHTHRKGKNNVLAAGPDDPGSPWAIGTKEGGHKAINPQLGTLDDLHDLIARAGEFGIEIGLDIAFHCSADHPYVKEHPEWLRWRPDGTVQYAENPPKKYQDIYPLDFETDDWQGLWQEMKSIVTYWIEQGIRIFRVDNPHTKPFSFWEWLITSVKEAYPEVVFLSEAFTRPKIMYQLAKLGFTQSYTYFAWRNTKWEIAEYFRELTRTEVREYFRPNLWPNTPDILTEYLQSGGRPAFIARLVLAATLGASYGIYGPAFELCENIPRERGSEEYFNSEKYEIRHWDIQRPDSLSEIISRVNRIRRENPALQSDWSLHFHPVDNEYLICYSKRTRDLSNVILVVVNLDPHYTQSGWVELPLDDLGLDHEQPYQVHDLLSDVRYLWHGGRNYVELNPLVVPAHIFVVRHRVRTERDFDYI